MPFCEAHVPLCEAHVPLGFEKKVIFVGKVRLCIFLSRNFDLRTSEAHFIKKSAVRGTAATCDSLVKFLLYFAMLKSGWTFKNLSIVKRSCESVKAQQ